MSLNIYIYPLISNKISISYILNFLIKLFQRFDMEERRLSLKECKLEIEERELKIERERLELQKLKHEFNANK